MSITPEQTQAAMEQMLKTGQAMTQAFLGFLSNQQANLTGQAGQSFIPPNFAPNFNPQSFMPQGMPPFPGFSGFPTMAPSAIPSLPQVSLPDSEPFVSLQKEYAAKHAQLWQATAQKKPGEASEPMVKAPAGDRRFSAPEWAESPVYDYLRQAYLLNAEYLQKVTDAMPVADGKAKMRLQFLTRQYIEAMSPSNFAATNPEFVKAALASNGESITRGIQNMLGDLEKGRISMTDDSAFEIGRNLATTAGSVVYENDLMQLIQYAPLTEEVYKTPLLFVPPCINKFYIMDLAPENSLVRFAIEQGHTLFLVSWKNPKAEQATTTWDDYLEKGPITALSVVREITGEDKPNVLGFCVGGTLLSSALAVLRGRGEDPVSSLTLMTTLLDFADAGELGCMVDEASVAAREAAIGKGGLLPGRDLAQVFSSLRANDLIWQYVVGNYLKGGKPQAFDLLYWNSDSTNLPGPFLTWYLRNMYLHNDLRVPGKLEMLGTKVDMGKVDAPNYLLATREDHIVPWDSAYLVRQILGGPSTFVLGASGHIAGAINPASKNRRSYWTSDSQAKSAQEWLAGAAEHKGSWWTHWAQWLAKLGGEKIKARDKLGNKKYKTIEPAPGRYVKEKA